LSFLVGGNNRLVWIADVLPNEIAGTIAEMIQQALNTMKATFKA
jgi:hypothetical protein